MTRPSTSAWLLRASVAFAGCDAAPKTDAASAEATPAATQAEQTKPQSTVEWPASAQPLPTENAAGDPIPESVLAQVKQLRRVADELHEQGDLSQAEATADQAARVLGRAARVGNVPISHSSKYRRRKMRTVHSIRSRYGAEAMKLPAVRDEVALHGERLAKLGRIRDLIRRAQEPKVDHDARVRKLLTAELRRHHTTMHALVAGRTTAASVKTPR